MLDELDCKIMRWQVIHDNVVTITLMIVKAVITVVEETLMRLDWAITEY